MRVADYIMCRLVEAGATHVFQVTGRGALFLSDALAKESQLKAVSLHHEQSCSYAAIGFAEKSRSLGVCLVSTGCASTNAITGVLSAWQDGIPCIFISGQNILRETTRFTGIKLRTYGQQEADIVELVSPITKYAHMVTDAESIGEVMDSAIHAATSGRKGPVWIDIPLDIQSARVDVSNLKRKSLDDNKDPQINSDLIETVCLEIMEATRPVILIGKGVRSSGAEEELRQFAGRTKIPITYTASAPDIIGSSSSMSIGSVGAMGCSRAGNFAVQNSDLLIVIGSRLTPLTTGTDFCKFARAAKTIVIDIDPVEHSKDGIRIDIFIHADIKRFLGALNQKPLKETSIEWIEKCNHWKNHFGKIEATFSSPDKIDLYQLSEALGRFLPANSSVVTDSGLVEVILPTNIRFPEGVDCIHPASQGAMGFALPAAIGVQHARSTDVIAIVGDGSIMMNLQELESVRYHALPLKILVINNNVYSIIRRRQRDLFRERIIGVDASNGVSCPDFQRVAECFGIKYQKISSVTDLESGLTKLFETEGAVLCEILGRENQEYIELGTARSNKDRRFVKRPLEDQIPFLPRDVFVSEMIVDPIDQ